ncbi:YezD family protein [Paenibacillus sp. GYB003]|uniref:YezD family protein n=1 Tax=Paenibacillus sp. GYB003 TaxID=2994392 RepID=UPI002F967339
MSTSVQLDDVWTERILSSVSGLEYGSVQIIVHDGKIVQIERTERKRFEAAHSDQNRQNKPKQQQNRRSAPGTNGKLAHWKKRTE